MLLAVRRRLPAGDWWWRATVLGVCNIGLFFPLIFLAAYQLPGRPRRDPAGGLAAGRDGAGVPGHRRARRAARIVAAVVGLVGVALLVLRSPGQVDTLGLVGAFGSVLVSALGFVLIKRWPPPVDMLTLVSWQLVVGGLALLPVACSSRARRRAIDLPAVGGFLWLVVAGTGLAYWCWFPGLAPCPPAPSR